MTQFVADITVDNIMDALGAFILLFIPGGQVVRAETNRAPLPPDPCVVLTEILQSDIDLPYQSEQQADSTTTLISPSRIDIQADFLGSSSGDYCKAVKGALRTLWGFDQFPAQIKPLYTSESHQAPLITGEQQYERRWVLTISIQYTPTVVVPQQFADVVTMQELNPVDVVDH